MKTDEKNRDEVITTEKNHIFFEIKKAEIEQLQQTMELVKQFPVTRSMLPARPDQTWQVASKVNT